MNLAQRNSAEQPRNKCWAFLLCILPILEKPCRILGDYMDDIDA